MSRPPLSFACLGVAAGFVLPPLLWPGLALGVFLGGGLLRSPYRETLLWFVGLPGLYVFFPVLYPALGGAALEGGALLAAFAGWGTLSLVLLLLGLAAGAMNREARLAPLWAAPLLLLRPEGPVLAVLVLAQALWTFERQGSERQGRPLLGKRLAVLLAAGLLAPLVLGLAGLELPRLAPPATSGGTPPAPQVAEAPAPPPPEGGGAPTVVTPPEPSALGLQLFRLIDVLAEVLLVVTLVVVVAALLTLVKHGRFAPRERLAMKDVFPLLLALFSLAMLLTWFALSSPGDGGGPLEAPPGEVAEGATDSGEPVRQERPAGLQETVLSLAAFYLLFVAALLLFVAALLVRTWFGRREPDEAARPSPQARARAGEGTPLNRVREAYRAFLRAMRRRGLGRPFWESPRAYAARLARLRPDLRGELDELTGLYESVRYGERSGEAEAARCERLAATLPPAFDALGASPALEGVDP